VGKAPVLAVQTLYETASYAGIDIAFFVLEGQSSIRLRFGGENMNRHHILESMTNFGGSIRSSSMKTMWIMGAASLACLGYACARAAAQDNAAAPPSMTINQSGQETESYWTPERMRSAKPMPMPAPPASWQPSGNEASPSTNASDTPGVSQEAEPPSNEVAPYGR